MGSVNDVIKLVKNVVKCLFACRFFSIFAMKKNSSVENVENFTKEVSEMCKLTHFPHFNDGGAKKCLIE
ncbi:hypothetical protein DWX90_04200 [Segatella copri]|uniref:Uncharacterized protein n=1 Tax=Segatella copri TaxID=165179 RepID=A0AA92TMU7_9BACT|nr:hypothetical protein DWX90_04200 [Segatella copri]